MLSGSDYFAAFVSRNAAVFPNFNVWAIPVSLKRFVCLWYIPVVVKLFFNDAPSSKYFFQQSTPDQEQTFWVGKSLSTEVQYSTVPLVTTTL